LIDRSAGPAGAAPSDNLGLMRIEIDRDVCIGTENCNRYAPGTFEVDDEGKVVQIGTDSDSEDAIRTAVESCPTGALSIVE
jgi:ferredoxin